MPLLYGEGEKAFRRLQGEIKVSDDEPIFAWTNNQLDNRSMFPALAPSIECFSCLSDVGYFLPYEYFGLVGFRANDMPEGQGGLLHDQESYRDLHPALLQGIRRRNLDMSNFHFCLWT